MHYKRLGVSLMFAIVVVLSFSFGPIGDSLSPLTRILLATMCSAAMFSISPGLGSGSRLIEVSEWNIKIVAHIVMLLSGVGLLVRSYGVNENLIGPALFFVGFSIGYLYWMWTGHKVFFLARSDQYTILSLLILIGMPAVTVGGIQGVPLTISNILAIPLFIQFVNLLVQVLAGGSVERNYVFPLEKCPFDYSVYFALFMLSVAISFVFPSGPASAMWLISIGLFLHYLVINFARYED